MGIAELLTEIGTGLGSFAPAFVKAMVETFVGLFFITGTEGTITGMSPVAVVSLTFFIIGMATRMVPTVASWLKLKIKGRKRSRARK